jgi:hypothetical protein
MKLKYFPIKLTAISFLSILLFFTACQKENSSTGTDEQQELEASKISSEADGEAEIIFNGIFDDAFGVNDEVGISGTGVFGRVTACPDVTIIRLSTTNPFPVRLILDFGNPGCIGRDGHLRRGKIITEYTNRLLIPGAMATTTFDGFYFDSTKVEGTHKITNTSPTVNTPPFTRQFTVDVTNAKLTKPNGNFIEWNSHKVITQIEGLTTNIPLDDIFRIEGSSNGKVKRGDLLVRWESTITEPLIKRFNCRWIVKGRVRIARANLGTNSPWIAILDFGQGTCDNQATITVNGNTHQITLP